METMSDIKEPTVKWTVKDSIFLDLVEFQENKLEFFRALHPESKDVTMDDITPVTLNPVILNSPYNDIGLLVKGKESGEKPSRPGESKLLILAEAQSTWSFNILLRMFMYTTATWQSYIHDNNLNVYSSRPLDIPKPEFYVIFTGSRKIKSDVITMKTDFWSDPNVKMDLEAKVIWAEKKGDVIGEFIILSHVFDEQTRLYGRSVKAVDNTIRICIEMGILVEYLSYRKKEVERIMMRMFEQEHVVEMYGLEREREGREEGKKIGKKIGIIEGAIGVYRDIGTSIEETVQKIASKFSLSESEAKQYVAQYW